MTLYKPLEKFSNKIVADAESKGLPISFKILDRKSCLIVNTSQRKMVLMTINALDSKKKEILSFGITVRKSNWEAQLKNSSEMELIGKLSNGPFKALLSNKIIDFIS